MDTKNRIYEPIPQHESHDESLNEEKKELLPFTRSQPPLPARWRIFIGIFCIVLLVSLGANAFFIYQQFIVPWELADRLPSRYAHLKRNISTEIVAHSGFDSMNRTTQGRAWDHPDLVTWSFFVALDDDYAASNGLPHSQRWPWDPHKGAYIPAGAHQLHCVKDVLRIAINEYYDGVPQANQTWPYGHLMHCLNLLRDAVMCTADDTPLYTGRLHGNLLAANTPKSGIGTIKMCRDWSALATWARAHSACYRPIHRSGQNLTELDRYKYCPDGSRPWVIEAPMYIKSA